MGVNVKWRVAHPDIAYRDMSQVARFDAPNSKQMSPPRARQKLQAVGFTAAAKPD
jgi:hypothetical protein